MRGERKDGASGLGVVTALGGLPEMNDEGS
jgi:hypothetical protein